MTITKLNGVSSGSQRIIKGNKGDDYNIETYGSDHIINIPIASATNTGLLSNVDWNTFSAAVFSSSNRPKTMIWVGDAIIPVPIASRNGAVSSPFLTPQEAIDWAALQPESSFQIIVAPGNYGDITLPADKVFIFETSSTVYGATINNVFVNSSAGPNNLIRFNNFAINNIDCLGNPGETIIVALAESCSVSGDITNSANVNCIIVSGGILKPSSGISSNSINKVDIGQNGSLISYNTSHSNSIDANYISINDGVAPLIINCSGNSISIINSEFQIGFPLITFTIGFGSVLMDTNSTVRFGLNGGDIVNGYALSYESTGPQLLRANTSFNALDSAVPSSSYSIQIASNTPDASTIGIVYPSVAINKMALVWVSGSVIPGVGLGIGSYYRDSSTGVYTNIVNTQQIGTSDSQNFFVNVKQVNSQQITLASLNPQGVWFPLEFVGPTSGSSSNISVTGFGVGVGFARIPKSGTLRNFRYTNATPSGSNFTNVQIYVAPNGDPFLLSFSGITLGINAGDYISSDTLSTLLVDEDDIIAVFNNDPLIGYTPDALTITADLLV